MIYKSHGNSPWTIIELKHIMPLLQHPRVHGNRENAPAIHRACYRIQIINFISFIDPLASELRHFCGKRKIFVYFLLPNSVEQCLSLITLLVSKVYVPAQQGLHFAKFTKRIAKLVLPWLFVLLSLLFQFMLHFARQTFLETHPAALQLKLARPTLLLVIQSHF
jgi:hypothetical protein